MKDRRGNKTSLGNCTLQSQQKNPVASPPSLRLDIHRLESVSCGKRAYYCHQTAHIVRSLVMRTEDERESRDESHLLAEIDTLSTFNIQEFMKIVISV